MAIELLSPAGNYDKLVAAFSYGADAAYMGMTEFSLRHNAGNFSQEEIEKVKALKEKTGKTDGMRAHYRYEPGIPSVLFF